MTVTAKQRSHVVERSDGQCEAMIKVGRTWSRCWASPIEIHHMLTRGRGGGVLDEVEESYHLIALCAKCHWGADGAPAYAGKLLIDGYVVWNHSRTRPVYVGTDSYLSSKYPKECQ